MCLFSPGEAGVLKERLGDSTAAETKGGGREPAD